MDIGHFGVGLALKKADTTDEVNLGLLTFAALFLDFMYYIFLVMGIEGLLTDDRNLTSALPYSHGVIATIVWSTAAFIMVWLYGRKRWKKPARSALIVALAVLSHLVLDIIYFMLGIPVDILNTIQWIIVVMGLWLYVDAVKRKAKVSVPGLVLRALIPVVVLLLPTIAMLFTGPISAAAIPNPQALGIVGVVQIILCVAIAFWVDRHAKSRKINETKDPVAV